MQSIPSWPLPDPAEKKRRQSALRVHAEATNRHFNAFASIEPPADKSHGALAGLPYAAKDMFRIAGRVPTCGLSDGSGIAITGESDLLQRLDDAGADRIGFTNMTELAYEPSGYNASRGRVRNPWNTDYIAGGSSSGSAVAVAIGAAVVAVGSDTAGSLRIPAHACGVTALKPTNGLVSARGAMPLSPSLDTIGFLARSAADLMLVASVGGLSLPKPRAVARATVLADAMEQSEPSVKAACSDAIDALEHCGVAMVRRGGLRSLEAIDPHVLAILQAEASRQHRAVMSDARLSASLRKRLTKGAEISDATLAAALATRAPLSRDFDEQVFSNADIILLPVMPIRTPDAALCDPDSDRFSPRTLYQLSRLTRFANFLGLPAVAVPAGFDDLGMPVALQIIGRPGQDLALLDLARTMQSRSDWHAKIPAAPAQMPLGKDGRSR